MAYDALICDLHGRTVAFVVDHGGITVTPRLCGYAEASVALEAHDASLAHALVGERALKIYEDGVLRFHGKIWEPLTRGSKSAKIVARDPLAEYAWRRVQTVTTYTAQDAGRVIAKGRVDAQNVRRNTYLRADLANLQASVSRDRTYSPGKLESEIFAELAAVDDGFFYRADPVDDVDGVMADLVVRYPDAGSTYEAVRFEYGENTLDNLVDYEITDFLPKNLQTVASALSTGGRIAETSSDAASIDRFGLFEEEVAFTDVSVAATLLDHAKALVRPLPVSTITLVPAASAPLLFTDFNVGDFVRVRILHGVDDVFSWARVLEATVTFDTDGVAKLTALVVELVTGGVLSESPERIFRRSLDDSRGRVEALERRVEGMQYVTPATLANVVTDLTGTINAGDVVLADLIAESIAALPEPTVIYVAPPAADPNPAAAPAPYVAPPSEPTYTPPPPPAPSQPPSIGGVSAWATNRSTIHVVVDGNGNGQGTSVTVDCGGGSVGGGVGSGGFHFEADIGGLTPDTAYGVTAYVSNASGTTTQGMGVIRTPSANYG